MSDTPAKRTATRKVAATATAKQAKPKEAPAAPKEDNLNPDAPKEAPAKAAPKRALPFVIKSTKASQDWLKMLVYGNYGTGKTTLAASAQDVPGMGDVIFIDAESGSMSLSDRDDIDSINITNYSQFARVYEYLRLHCRARDADDVNALVKLESTYKGIQVSPKNVKRYRTVVIDSITEVQKYCMYQLLNMEVGDYELDMEPQAAQFAEWGKAAEMIRLLVRSFRNLPMHVIIVAAEQSTEDETKRQLKSPALPGKLSKEIQGFLDVVAYLYAASTDQGMRRRLYLEPGKTFDAKSRAQWIKEAYIDEPTMSLVMQRGN